MKMNAEQYSEMIRKREKSYNEPITKKDINKLHEIMVRMIRQQHQSDIGRQIALACDYNGEEITKIAGVAFMESNYHEIADYLREELK
jgi:hypothetical protein